MKRFILFAVTLLPSLFYAVHSNAQACGVSNLGIQLVSQADNGSGGCTVVFNLSWDQTFNNGNKWSFVHLWQAAQYPTINYGHAPNATDLASSLGTLVLKDGTLQTGTSAYPNGTVTILSAASGGSSLNPNGSTHYVFNNVTINFATCPLSISLKGDVWSSNANNGNVVHCVTQGVSFSLSDPVIVGTYYCASLTPLTAKRDYKLDITPTGTFTASYNILVDDGDGNYETDGSDVLAQSVNNLALSSAYTSGRVSLPAPYSTTTPYINHSLFAVVTLTDALNNTFSRIILLENTCAPTVSLPVKFKSFNAIRKEKMVQIKWETAVEEDNKGFYIQRYADGEWKNIAFAFSQGVNGNSDQPLAYSYNELNASKEISKYRILQVDLNGRTNLSETRFVKGLEQVKNCYLFPNPSSGKVNVVFDDISLRDIMVSDASGRTIRSYKDYTSNNFSVEHLNPGFYLMTVFDKKSNTSYQERFIIKN